MPSVRADRMADGKSEPEVVDLRDMTYVDSDQDFIVVLAVGYNKADFDDPSRFSPDIYGALGAALDLTRDDGSSDTHWWVYDRANDRWQYLEQGEAEGE